jgi:DNA polymerase III subunit delta
MSIDALKNDIKSKQIRSLYLLYGPEEYRKKQWTNVIVNTALNGDVSQMNRVVFDDKTNIRQIADECNTIPFFSDRKVIIIHNSGFFKASEKSTKKSVSPEKNPSKKEELKDLLWNIPKHACVIFVENSIDKRLKVLDAFSEKGLCVELGYLKPAEMNAWILKEFRSKGKKISNTAVTKLLEYCDHEMSMIDLEIRKLVDYSGDKPEIEKSMIESVCIKSIKSRIFDLTDAIANKDNSKALQCLSDLISIKEPVQKIIVMIANQFGNMMALRTSLENRISSNECAKLLSMHPYAAEICMRQSKNFTKKQLKNALNILLITDERIKTGKMEPRISLETALIEIVGVLNKKQK